LLEKINDVSFPLKERLANLINTINQENINFNNINLSNTIKNKLSKMIKMNKPVEKLDNIFNDLNKKTLVVDFENLNFGVQPYIQNMIEVYSKGTKPKNELRNNLAFILNMMIEENFEKLFIVCKLPIYNIFDEIFLDDGFEYTIYVDNKETDVYYHMKNTIDKIKKGLMNKTLSIDIINLQSEIPHTNYDLEPHLKKLNSFDDCTIVYLANKLMSNNQKYKIISSDLRMFNDFNEEERQILLPYFLIRSSLIYIPIGNQIKLESIEYLINPIDDPFFRSPVNSNKILENEICMIRTMDNDTRKDNANPCKRNVDRNLHKKMEEHYFHPNSKLNHINKSKNKIYSNITESEVKTKFSENVDPYYIKYIKYKNKYLNLKFNKN
jgi:hypothetical protein